MYVASPGAGASILDELEAGLGGAYPVELVLGDENRSFKPCARFLTLDTVNSDLIFATLTLFRLNGAIEGKLYMLPRSQGPPIVAYVT